MKSIFGESDYALPEWMHALMETIDSDAVTELRKNDLVYTALFKTCIELQEQHTFLQNLLDGEDALILSKEEHGIFIEYMAMRNAIESRERQLFYRYGHAHCFEYLKKIGFLSRNEK